MQIVGDALPNMPWEPKPKNCLAPMWRYSKNPILGWNPMPGVARIFNSAVVAHQGGISTACVPLSVISVHAQKAGTECVMQGLGAGCDSYMEMFIDAE